MTRDTDRERIKHLLNFIEPEELNDWENEFYFSVKEQFEQRGSLTDKQVAVLEKIYGKGGD